MSKLYEKALIEKLQDIATTQKYYGELEHPTSAQFVQNDLPLIYVDFLEEKPMGNLHTELTYSLYIVHLSYSKHKSTRTQKHYELYDLNTDIRKALFCKSILDSKPISLSKLSKIYDAVSPHGYLTVYKRDLTFEIKND